MIADYHLLHAIFYAKHLSGGPVEAWDAANREVERYRDEAQRREMPNLSTSKGGAYAGDRPASDSGGGERPCSTKAGGGADVPAAEAVARIYAPAPEEVWRPCIKRPVVVHVRAALPKEGVFTREGLTLAKPGDLVMRGIDGEIYPIGRSIFLRTYDMVPGDAEVPGEST